jgi:hypothetical protein
MERRRDYRHGFRYLLSVKCRRTLRVRNDLMTEDVSASGLRLAADTPHGLRPGDRIEVQLFARVPGNGDAETLVMATDATVVRTGKHMAALRFEAPLMY